MAIGERIKRIRTFRKMTQSQLGDAVGLSDVHIRQYELGNRTPKTDMMQQMAEALDCNYRSIDEPTLYATEDVMFDKNLPPVRLPGKNTLNEKLNGLIKTNDKQNLIICIICVSQHSQHEKC